jgi:hypothetical protein
MISFDEVQNGLFELGFENGWAYSDIGYPEGILIWEHSEAMPSIDQVKKAASLRAESLAKSAKADESKREALLKKLGLTADEFASLVSAP